MSAERKGGPLEALDVSLELIDVEERRIERMLTIKGFDTQRMARLAESPSARR